MTLLALVLACEGSIEAGDPQRDLSSDATANSVDADPTGSNRGGGGAQTPTADPGAVEDPPSGVVDAGAESSGDTDAGTASAPDAGGAGGSTDPCAGGPLVAPIPNCRPAPAPSTADPHADCVARINRFRWECQCLPPLERWMDGEDCTDSNAQYDSVNGVHASFYDIPCGSGARAQNECPGWPSRDHVITGCLQSMWDEGPEDGNPNTVNGHYETMATTTYTRVACGFYTTPSGEVWGVQNFD
jgi:hypothetical protein